MNEKLKLGQMLCRSREPNFLMDVIKRQVRVTHDRCDVSLFKCLDIDAGHV